MPLSRRIAWSSRSVVLARVLLTFCMVVAGAHASLEAQQLLASATPDSIGSQVSELAPTPAHVAVRESTGSLAGMVLDPGGDPVANARVTLAGDVDRDPRSMTTGSGGRFTFPGLPSGSITLTVDAAGFARWSWSGSLPPQQDVVVPGITLEVAGAKATVEVTATAADISAAQVALEEKQRVLGFFPNFYAAYVWNAEPLTPRQKFRMAWKTMTDPVAFGATAVVAGFQQSQNDFKGYGQGVQGYAKRYGAGYADGFVNTMLGGAVLPTILHQDPRYFVKGTGTVRSRVLYAVASTVVCKGDNGRWQPNYSNVLANVSSAGVSNLYYPATDRHGASLTISGALLQTAGGAFGSLMQEFALRRMTPHVPDYGAAQTR